MISVVVPAYNEQKLLPACLDSLAAQKTKKKFEVLVVDNNSTDSTNKIANSYKKKIPGLQVIVEKKKGRGQARYTGFAKASGDIILSTDADTVVPPNWVDAMTTPLEKNKNIIATTGPCKITDNSTFTNTLFNFLQPLGMHLYRGIYKHYWLSGFSFGIRKKAYLQSGGFNPKLKAQEDTDLAFRVAKVGNIQYVSAAKVIFSGRRFQNGLLQGLQAYGGSFFAYSLFGRKDIDLSDLR